MPEPKSTKYWTTLDAPNIYKKQKPDTKLNAYTMPVDTAKTERKAALPTGDPKQNQGTRAQSPAPADKTAMRIGAVSQSTGNARILPATRKQQNTAPKETLKKPTTTTGKKRNRKKGKKQKKRKPQPNQNTIRKWCKWRQRHNHKPASGRKQPKQPHSGNNRNKRNPTGTWMLRTMVPQAKERRWRRRSGHHSPQWHQTKLTTSRRPRKQQQPGNHMDTN